MLVCECVSACVSARALQANVPPPPPPGAAWAAGPAATRPPPKPRRSLFIILMYSPSLGPRPPQTPKGQGAEREVYVSIIYAKHRAAAVIGEELGDPSPSTE